MEFAVIGSDEAVRSRLTGAMESVSNNAVIRVIDVSCKDLLFLCNPVKIELLVCELDSTTGYDFKVIEQATRLGIKSLIVAESNSKQFIVRALSAGANGCLSKYLSADEYGAAIRQVFNGGCPVATVAFSRLDDSPESQTSMQKCVGSAAVNAQNLLSRRELQVLKLIAKGNKTLEIASVLSISEHTVANHCRAIYKKMEINSRSQAIGIAYQSGIVS